MVSTLHCLCLCACGLCEECVCVCVSECNVCLSVQVGEPDSGGDVLWLHPNHEVSKRHQIRHTDTH